MRPEVVLVNVAFSCGCRDEGGTYNALGDGLTDGVDLGSVSTTTHADADVDVGWRNIC